MLLGGESISDGEVSWFWKIAWFWLNTGHNCWIRKLSLFKHSYTVSHSTEQNRSHVLKIVPQPIRFSQSCCWFREICWLLLPPKWCPLSRWHPLFFQATCVRVKQTKAAKKIFPKKWFCILAVEVEPFVHPIEFIQFTFPTRDRTNLHFVRWKFPLSTTERACCSEKCDN